MTGMTVSTERELVDTIYQALARRDRETLARSLDPDVVSRVTDSLPAGAGGEHRGAEALLRDVWGAVARHYQVRPEPDEFLSLADGGWLVLGRYRGVARATGRTVDAAFAHVWRFRDGRVVRLDQVTDGHPWLDALQTPIRT
jgi:2-(1,2-epoxy-1,2-dihydrophenyl)acetyl-CoA isomerase